MYKLHRKEGTVPFPLKLVYNVNLDARAQGGMEGRREREREGKLWYLECRFPSKSGDALVKRLENRAG